MDSASLVIEKKEYILLKRLINLSGYYKDRTLLKNLEKLSSKLETAQIYSEDEMPNNVVRINSIVTINSKDNHQENFQLVLPAKDNSNQSNVSLFTHLGAALIGQMEGNEITVDYASNKKTLLITKVSQQNKNISLDMVL
jgi:regulator of nucleoside diphosphate kinase